MALASVNYKFFKVCRRAAFSLRSKLISRGSGSFSLIEGLHITIDIDDMVLVIRRLCAVQFLT
jgi:hypothetical protein